MRKIMSSGPFGLRHLIDDCIHRHFNHVTPGTPRWHEIQAFRNDLEAALSAKPEDTFAKDITD